MSGTPQILTAGFMDFMAEYERINLMMLPCL